MQLFYNELYYNELCIKSDAGTVSIRVSRKGDYWAVHYSINGLDWKNGAVFPARAQKEGRGGGLCAVTIGEGVRGGLRRAGDREE